MLISSIDPAVERGTMLRSLEGVSSGIGEARASLAQEFQVQKYMLLTQEAMTEATQLHAEIEKLVQERLQGQLQPSLFQARLKELTEKHIGVQLAKTEMEKSYSFLKSGARWWTVLSQEKQDLLPLQQKVAALCLQERKCQDLLQGLHGPTPPSYDLNALVPHRLFKGQNARAFQDLSSPALVQRKKIMALVFQVLSKANLPLVLSLERQAIVQEYFFGNMKAYKKIEEVLKRQGSSTPLPGKNPGYLPYYQACVETDLVARRSLEMMQSALQLGAGDPPIDAAVASFAKHLYEKPLEACIQENQTLQVLYTHLSDAEKLFVQGMKAQENQEVMQAYLSVQPAVDFEMGWDDC
jgi:hypothetical protein